MVGNGISEPSRVTFTNHGDSPENPRGGNPSCHLGLHRTYVRGHDDLATVGLDKKTNMLCVYCMEIQEMQVNGLLVSVVLL